MALPLLTPPPPHPSSDTAIMSTSFHWEFSWVHGCVRAGRGLYVKCPLPLHPHGSVCSCLSCLPPPSFPLFSAPPHLVLCRLAAFSKLVPCFSVLYWSSARGEWHPAAPLHSASWWLVVLSSSFYVAGRGIDYSISGGGTLPTTRKDVRFFTLSLPLCPGSIVAVSRGTQSSWRRGPRCRRSTQYPYPDAGMLSSLVNIIIRNFRSLGFSLFLHNNAIMVRRLGD